MTLDFLQVVVAGFLKSVGAGALLGLAWVVATDVRSRFAARRLRRNLERRGVRRITVSVSAAMIARLLRAGEHVFSVSGPGCPADAIVVGVSFDGEVGEISLLVETASGASADAKVLHSLGIAP